MTNINFGSATHIYFYTDDGKRIISDENMKKCERYVVGQLNGSKNYKTLNQDLRNTFTYDKKHGIGDKDYYEYPYTRSIYEYSKNRAKGYVNILSGADAVLVNETYGKNIGLSKHESLARTGSTESFESDYAVRMYNENAPKYSDLHGIFKDGKRQAFGVMFKPVYKKNGELKNFEYVRSGYFDENKITNK